MLYFLRVISAREALWRAEEREQFSIEAAFSRSTGHLHREHRRSERSRDRIEARRVFVTESLHDHGFAHAAVAINRNGWHPRSPRMVEQEPQTVEGLFGPRIQHPAAREGKPQNLV